MTTTNPPALISRRLVLLISAIFAAALTGCASGDPELMLSSTNQRQSYTQQFRSAYCTQDSKGDTDIVLVDHASESAASHATDQTCPVRHVMHIHVLWQPKRDMKFEHSSASNATVHWYVMGNTPETSAAVLEYAGTAWVASEEDGSTTQLTVRNAVLRPVGCRGQIADPVGPCVLQGSFAAAHDARRVRQFLIAVRMVVASAEALPGAAAAHAKPAMPSLFAQ